MTTKTTSTGIDAVTNLSNLLPTGTFLAFQTLSPLFTNNGDCGRVEKIMTGLLIGMFEVICFVLNFTDSVTTTNGKVYYGVVTKKGLFSPRFEGSGLQGAVGMFYDDNTGKYLINAFDYINGILSIIIFSGLSLLTPPITTCFYPTLSSTVVKTVPILLGLIVGSYFSFAPHVRSGVGFALVTGKAGLQSDAPAVITTLKASKKVAARETSFREYSARQVLLEKGDYRDSARNILPHVRNHGNPVFEPSPTLTPASSPLQISPNRALDRDPSGSRDSTPVQSG